MAATDRLRSRPARSLLWAALLMSLVLGAGVVALTGPGPGRGQTMSDDDAATQVVSAARRMVAAGLLRDATGGYAFMPCGADDGPPYQATLHLSFAVPPGDPGGYLDTVAARLIADGWAAGAGERFDRKLSADGVVALFERPSGRGGFATAKLYGECRVDGDHRRDDPAWTEVSF